MAFLIVVTPGAVLAVNTLVDNPTLNLLGQPTITVTGNLADLTNVSSTAPADLQPLVWDAGSSKWCPALTVIGRQYLQTMTGASASVNGASGAATRPLAGDNEKFLRGDGTWQNPAVAPGNDLFAADNYF